MSTGAAWANLFPQRILDLAALRTNLAEPVRETLGDALTDMMGAGGVMLSAAAFTDAGSLLTLTADRTAWTGQGERLLLDNAAGAGFSSVPYQATGGTTYYLGARYQEKPAGAVLGFEGTPGFLTWNEAIGELYTPGRVTPLGGGTGLRFELATALPAAMKWSTAGTRPVTVWKVNPVTATSEAVASGTLTRSGASYRVDIAHYFGQSSSSPSTTAADYRVLVEGLTISAADLSANAAYAYLGTMLSGTHDATGQRILQPLSYWLTLFQAEHDVADGKHTTIRPQVIIGRGGSGDDLEIQGNVVSLVGDVGATPIAQVLARAAGSVARLYQANVGTSTVQVDRDTGAVLISASTADVRIDAVAGTTTLAGATLQSEDTHRFQAGTLASPSAANRYYGYASALRFSTPIPITGWCSDAPPEGPHGLQYDSGSTRGVILTNADGSTQVDIVAARDLEYFEANPTGPTAVYELARVSLSVLWDGGGTFDLHLREIDRASGSVNKSSSRTGLAAAGTYLIPSGADLSGWTVDASTYRYVVEIVANNVDAGFTGVNLTGGHFESLRLAVQ